MQSPHPLSGRPSRRLLAMLVTLALAAVPALHAAPGGAPGPGAPRLRVVSYNIWGLWLWSRHREARVARIGPALAQGGDGHVGKGHVGKALVTPQAVDQGPQPVEEGNGFAHERPPQGQPAKVRAASYTSAAGAGPT